VRFIRVDRDYYKRNQCIDPARLKPITRCGETHFQHELLERMLSRTRSLSTLNDSRARIGASMVKDDSVGLNLASILPLVGKRLKTRFLRRFATLMVVLTGSSQLLSSTTVNTSAAMPVAPSSGTLPHHSKTKCSLSALVLDERRRVGHMRGIEKLTARLASLCPAYQN